MFDPEDRMRELFLDEFQDIDVQGSDTNVIVWVNLQGAKVVVRCSCTTEWNAELVAVLMNEETLIRVANALHAVARLAADIDAILAAWNEQIAHDMRWD